MITVKKVQISRALSQGTTAHSCEVFWEGRRIAFATNFGDGRMTDLTPIGSSEDYVAASRMAETKPMQDLDFSQIHDAHGKPMFHTLDSYVDELVEVGDIKKSIKTRLNRDLKTKAIFVDGCEIRASKHPYSDKLVQALRPKHPNAVFLNKKGIDEAVELWYEAERQGAAAAH